MANNLKLYEVPQGARRPGGLIDDCRSLDFNGSRTPRHLLGRALDAAKNAGVVPAHQRVEVADNAVEFEPPLPKECGVAYALVMAAGVGAAAVDVLVNTGVSIRHLETIPVAPPR